MGSDDSSVDANDRLMFKKRLQLQKMRNQLGSNHY
jgi:hypothetical protein